MSKSLPTSTSTFEDVIQSDFLYIDRALNFNTQTHAVDQKNIPSLFFEMWSETFLDKYIGAWDSEVVDPL